MNKFYKINIFIIFIIFIILSAFSCSNIKNNKDTIFQYSTINALLEGYYDGDLTLRNASKYGDFGIGTFNNLDGEMIFLDNKFYQIKSDGNVYEINESSMTPFIAVTNFEIDKKVEINKNFNFKELEDYIDSLLPGDNIPYAIKVKGSFDKMKVRSVPKQSKPYKKLVEIVKNQPVFELSNTTGTIIGFKLPKYVNNINVAGYHFHFITDDKKKGGHVLDFQLKNGIIEIDYTYDFYMIIPQSDDFNKIDLEKEKSKELKKVEK